MILFCHIKRNSRISIFFLSILYGITNTQPVRSIPELSEKQWLQSDHGRNRAQLLKGSFVKTEASLWFDVTYYRLNLKIETQPILLIGDVNITGVCRTDGANTLTLDLVNQLNIDSVVVNGKACSFTQNISSFTVSLPRPTSMGEILSLEVFYRGIPLLTRYSGFTFDTHDGLPWIYTQSEPYGAKEWWPCKDDPGDKADSADIIITCSSLLKAGSQGVLVSATDNGDGTTTFYWKERYPIAAYLISIAAADYIQFSNWFKYSDTDSMEIRNFVMPEHYSEASLNIPLVSDMLRIFSDMFGVYPFIKEKYGHAEHGRTGAMENQTLTFTNSFEENILTHELAHQWFGDMITCSTWYDLWLNEGFAQYSTALYLERKYGIDSYRAYMNIQLEHAKLTHGAVGDPDISDAGKLFETSLVYSKGASVLHMLRNILGDSVFFEVIHAYANNPILKYSTATTNDFKSVCETVSGINLNYFFQQWIYGHKYPEYIYSWTWDQNANPPKIILNIRQSINESGPSFFTMPVELRIIAADNDTAITLWNDRQEQTFTIPFSNRPLEILLDPEGWILKNIYTENGIPPVEYRLKQNYPNPFNSGTTIAYDLPETEHVTLKIYDLLGHEIDKLVDIKQFPGKYSIEWSPKNSSSGIYFYRLAAGSRQLWKKMILLK